RFDNESALHRLDAQTLRDLIGNSLDTDPEPAAGDLSFFLQLADHRLHSVSRDGKADTSRAATGRQDRAVYTDHVAFEIEGRTAGVALIDRRVDLHEVVIGSRLEIARAGRHNSARDRATQPEGIAHRQDPLADAWGPLCQAHEWKLLIGIHLQQGEIRFRIGSDQLG